MNEYTATVGLLSSLLALVGFPFMFADTELRRLYALLLATPFVAFMVAFTFFGR